MRIIYWLEGDKKPYLIRISLKKWYEKIANGLKVMKWQEEQKTVISFKDMDK